MVTTKVARERKGRDVFVVGAANVGKSAFVRAMLKEMSAFESSNYDPAAMANSRYLPVESAMPGTTLGFIPLQVRLRFYMLCIPVFAYFGACCRTAGGFWVLPTPTGMYGKMFLAGVPVRRHPVRHAWPAPAPPHPPHAEPRGAQAAAPAQAAEGIPAALTSGAFWTRRRWCVARRARLTVHTALFQCSSTKALREANRWLRPGRCH